MPLVWASLALAMLLWAIGVVIAFRHGRAAWRDFRRTGQALAAAIDEVGGKAERAAAKADALGAVTARAQPATASLRTSLSRLAVLRAAIGDVQSAVGRVTAVYPRK